MSTVIITSANTHDLTVAIDTVDSMVIKRPSSKSTTKYRNNNDKNKNKKKNQNLCLDKAYHSKEIEQEITKRGYIPHIRHRKEQEKKHNNIHPARRWMVEREQIHGIITDSENYIQEMKRMMRTILVL